jgi:peptide/nickel transport system substrate-binding protein
MKKTILLSVIFLIVSSSCAWTQPATAPAIETPTLIQFPVQETPTVSAPRSLTVCLGQEPNTLYPFGGPNSAARSVLSAIYDGPIDMIGYEYQPVILEKLPSIEDGDAQVTKIAVKPGDEVINSNGDLVTLKLGEKVRPASCRADSCSITYDGSSPLEMDQMNVVFKLRTDITWSDGTPLTADDSVYAYQIASDPNSLGYTYLTDRTSIYEALDASSVQWWGKPGYVDPQFFTNFIPPAPKHLWSQYESGSLLTLDLASRAPLGWGPYVVQEWQAADHITLAKNPYYFRLKDGFPKFDTLTFRFITDPNTAISELTTGRCDIIDPTIRLDGQIGLLDEMQRGGQLFISAAPGMTIEWLALGVNPSAYDDGIDPIYARDREPIFADLRTRQAIAYCVDRQKIVDTVLFGLTTVPASFVPNEHPAFNNTVSTYTFDPATGNRLLDEAGWRDIDNDPSTPRSAVAVQGVRAGTNLALNYYTTSATQRRQVTEIIVQSLAQCGISVTPTYMSQNDFYASGPQGVLFGRTFDAAEYAMGVNGLEPPCEWFTTKEIPNSKNLWIGTNVSGYQNPDYDNQCQTARSSIRGEPSYNDAMNQTQRLFAQELPSIPLYFRLKLAAMRPDMCGFQLDPTASPLWNIELFDYGESCKQQ